MFSSDDFGKLEQIINRTVFIILILCSTNLCSSIIGVFSSDDFGKSEQIINRINPTECSLSFNVFMHSHRMC